MNNLANIAGTLARAEESLGHEAKVLVPENSRWAGDFVLPTHGHPLTWNLGVLSRWRLFADADVIHVHGGIWNSQLAIELLRRVFRGKVLVVHLHGSETRTGRGLHHLGWADAIVCATPDLVDLVPSA
ncbi:MAG TPA: glycosyltransferase, partial [Thermoplasmata archaeon]|nr:glycosyltransferase [Thermoplasmata archaeon]